MAEKRHLPGNSTTMDATRGLSMEQDTPAPSRYREPPQEDSDSDSSSSSTVQQDSPPYRPVLRDLEALPLPLSYLTISSPNPFLATPIAPVQALPQIPMAATAPLKIKVAEPEAFDGSASKFRDWHRQLLIYIRGCRITDDDDKILLTLSYMKSGTATAWATRFFDSTVTNDNFGSWNQFEDQLKATFEDKTQGRRARERLENFRQGSRNIDDYVSRFQALAQDANLHGHDAELIRLLKRNVDANIIDSIYASGRIPVDFDLYEERVVTLGRLQERR